MAGGEEALGNLLLQDFFSRGDNAVDPEEEAGTWTAALVEGSLASTEEAEARKGGRVESLKVFVRAQGGIYLVGGYLLMELIAQFSPVVSTVWLGYWTEHLAHSQRVLYNGVQRTLTLGEGFSVYALILVVTVFFVFACAYVQTRMSIRGSTHVHRSLVHTFIHLCHTTVKDLSPVSTDGSDTTNSPKHAETFEGHTATVGDLTETAAVMHQTARDMTETARDIKETAGDIKETAGDMEETSGDMEETGGETEGETGKEIRGSSVGVETMLNRLSKDLQKLDCEIPLQCSFLVKDTLLLIALIVSAIWQTPLSFPFFVVILYFYLRIQDLYVSTMRQLLLNESKLTTPLVATYLDCSNGALTLRRYGDISISWARQRCAQAVDRVMTPAFTQRYINAWAFIRLGTLGSVILVFLAVFFVLQGRRVSPATVAVVLRLATSATASLNWLVSVFA